MAPSSVVLLDTSSSAVHSANRKYNANEPEYSLWEEIKADNWKDNAKKVSIMLCNLLVS